MSDPARLGVVGARPSGPAYELRDATCLDVPALAAHETTLFGADAWSQATWWGELAARPRREYVIAHPPGAPTEIVGYAGIDVAGEGADIMTIAVVERARGTGLGRVLLDELAGRARARGADALLLEVRADNTPALGLYAGAGFARLSVRRRYYQPGDVDAHVMRKVLS